MSPSPDLYSANSPLQWGIETEVTDVSEPAGDDHPTPEPGNGLTDDSSQTTTAGPSSIPNDPNSLLTRIVPNGSSTTNISSQIDDASTVEDRGPKVYKTIRLWNRERGIGLEIQVHQLKPDDTSEQLRLIPSCSPADSGTEEAQERFKTKAYNGVVPIKEPTHNASNTGSANGNKSLVFMACIRFFEGEKEADAPRLASWPELPTSKEIYAYVGASPAAPDATGTMWETIFTERRKRLDHASDLDLAEVGLIGRSLEKILQVDMVPAHFDKAGDDDAVIKKMVDSQKKAMKKLRQELGIEEEARSQGRSQADNPQETALMSNIFLLPNVNLKSLL